MTTGARQQISSNLIWTNKSLYRIPKRAPLPGVIRPTYLALSLAAPEGSAELEPLTAVVGHIGPAAAPYELGGDG